MKLKCMLVLAWFSATSSVAGNSIDDFVLGHWITESGNLEVSIEPCAQALCGTVVKVLGNRSMKKTDEVMDPVDKRPALGMKILTDFVGNGDGELQGHIYNRENGKTYDCLLSEEAPDRLKVRAYKFLPLFGKTQIWKRVSMPQASRTIK